MKPMKWIWQNNLSVSQKNKNMRRIPVTNKLNSTDAEVEKLFVNLCSYLSLTDENTQDLVKYCFQ